MARNYVGDLADEGGRYMIRGRKDNPTLFLSVITMLAE